MNVKIKQKSNRQIQKENDARHKNIKGTRKINKKNICERVYLNKIAEREREKESKIKK